MSDQQVWAQVAKTSSSVQLRQEELAFLLNASQGIELPYTASMSKRKQTALLKEKQCALLNRIGPALL